MRVLVVSEREDVRGLATTALTLRDAEVTEAHSSRQARELAIEQDFDVLVIDGDMSPKGGFSLLYEIREGGELRGLSTPPALVMMAREQDRWLAAWAGANEVLRKPVDPFQLAKRVDALAGADAPPSGARESGEQVDDIIAETGRDPEDVRERAGESTPG